MKRAIVLPAIILMTFELFWGVNPFKCEDCPKDCDSLDVALYPYYMSAPETSVLQVVSFISPVQYKTYDWLFEPYDVVIYPNPVDGYYCSTGSEIVFYEYSQKELYDNFRYLQPHFEHFGDRLCGLRVLSYIPVGKNGDRGDNVSVGSIRNFGESISITTTDESGREYEARLCYVPGKKFFSEKLIHPREMFPNIVWGAYAYPHPLSNDSSKISREFDYYPWHPTALKWQDGVFKVRSVYHVGEVTTKIDLERDSVLIRIVNPLCYMRHSGMNLYKKDEASKVTEWMKSAKEGDSCRLELMRPLYPTDSVSHIKPLNTGPDTVYTAFGEAYGYFFAKPIEK